MATACLRDFTTGPFLDPERSLPALYSRITFLTFVAFFIYIFLINGSRAVFSLFAIFFIVLTNDPSIARPRRSALEVKDFTISQIRRIDHILHAISFTVLCQAVLNTL
jgi:hypothetical protein